MYLLKLLSNLPGWRTQRKIVVIESDDWGSIRMPSLKSFEKLKAKGVNISKGDNGRFNTLDTLANTDDFQALFETLCVFKDKNGNHPVFTPMALVANPDFDKIKNDNYSQYYYKSIFETLKDYNQEKAITHWKECITSKLFVPEFHGREHLNVRLWLQALQQDDKDTLLAFDEQCWGFKPKNASYSYQAAFHVEDMQKDIPSHKYIIKDGVMLFQQLFNRKPKYFVPPNGAIHQQIIDFSVSEGLHYVSSPKIFSEPQGKGKIKKRFRFIGKKGKNGLIYLTRNCFFEPSYNGKGHTLEDCLMHIQTAFQFKKPAVISTHRVNYIGGLNEKNRKDGNKALKSLLHQILKKWPDVEFMTSTQLGDVIKNDQN